ncbi:ArnT family glycosyltransferase [Hymenobacter caeli]|uniref:4-amino-4-deoxy-L-arabinose transferase-like glycosyltransferase n=1 Tax=Hymenobacter caeli TaxID=2735894 RepID=A0ABX2FRT9_9BACT|nr:glycosyltransferase family 39 protein [Hymenobacter caeli]NRT19236.1 4-amino-4-deoxy-L-arabinose transferase-like glycosyltransferase [Hymenobacter caeli]
MPLSSTLRGPLAGGRQWLRMPANQLLLLLLGLAAFPLLFELGRSPVQLWDESRLAMNAMEMSRGGNWLVTTFQGQPDHWNTKPPLLIWLQVIAFKTLGYSNWALRLPSALAALGTVLLLYRFAAGTLRRPLAGFFGGLVLVTAAGYVRLHGARTGDYDALLAFWEVVAWLAFFQYLETARLRHLYWLGAAFTAAVLTKGVAGLLGGPALLVYAAARGKLPWLLRQPRLYVVAAVGLAIVAAYYLAHEALDPGYLAAVRANELGGRYNQVLDGHTGPWTYYFDRLYTIDFAGWIWWLVPAGLVWLQPDRLVRRAGSLLLLFALGWMLLCSASATKLEWYALPAYPALALLIGLGLDFLYHDVLAANLPRVPRAWAWPLRVGLVAGLFFFPFRAIMRQLVDERYSDYGTGSDAHLARYAQQVAQEQPLLDGFTLLNQGGYNPVLLYYQAVLQLAAHKTVAIRYQGEARALQPGTVVLVCDPAYRARLDSSFQLVLVHQAAPCEAVLLTARK